MVRIAIPITIKVREFDGKLWLASQLAESGYKVAIGDLSDIRKNIFDEIRPDGYISPSLVFKESKRQRFENLRSCGVTNMVIDTEGGVFKDDIDYPTKRMSDKLANYPEIIFTWGEIQANAFQEHHLYSNSKIISTGNPRFDLLNKNLRGIYREKAHNIKDRYGKIILFNTNFSTANYHPRNAERIDSESSKFKHQYKLISKFISAIKEASNLHPNHTIIIRPHPAENHEYYVNKFSDCDSIIVKYSGDVRSWIYSADCVIHNSCTTGIEAALLNTPVIAYEPKTNVENYPYSHLPNVVSKSIYTHENLLKQIKTYVSQNESYELTSSQERELQKYFTNIEEPAVPKIVNEINDIQWDKNKTSYSEPSIKQKIKTLVKQTPAAPYIQRVQSSNNSYSDYENQKFPGLSIEEVRSRLQDLEKEVGEMNLKVSRLNHMDDVYWIEQ